MDGDGSSNNARGEAEPTYCPRFTASPVQMDESEDGDGPRWQFVGSGGQLITGAIAAPPRDGQDMGNGGQGVVQYFDDHHLDGADGRLSLPPIGGPYTINDHQSMAPLLTGSEPLYVLGGGYGKRAIVHNVRITPGGRRGGYYYVHMERGQFPPHVTASLSLLHEEQQGQNHPELQVEGMNPLVSGAQSNQAQQTPDQDHHEPRMPTTAEASGTSSTQGQQAHSPTPASGPGTSLEERGMLGATPVFDESIRQIALFPQGRSRIVVLCRDETLYSVSFKVSSTLMFFEACGWIAFLDSGPDSTATFKVQQQGGVRAMAIVLHLIHRLDVYHPVPAQLPLTTLGYVVAITEAFRCKEILDVFGPQWLAPFHDLGVSYKLHDRHDHGWLLYLALQSRDQPLFASLARFIQNHHTIDADADFLCGCGQKLTAHVPDDLGILEKVTPRLGMSPLFRSTSSPMRTAADHGGPQRNSRNCGRSWSALCSRRLAPSSSASRNPNFLNRATTAISRLAAPNRSPTAPSASTCGLTAAWPTTSLFTPSATVAFGPCPTPIPYTRAPSTCFNAYVAFSISSLTRRADGRQTDNAPSRPWTS